MKSRLLSIVITLSILSQITGTAVGCTNIRPDADIVAFPKYVIIGNDVTLDGRGSFDTDGTIIKYEWDFDNDGTYDCEETPTTSTCDEIADYITTHTYSNSGTYTVMLKVTDNGYLTGTATCTVYVGPARVYNVTKDTWYSYIQHAIDESDNENVIQATEGTYNENINFDGKNITVESHPANTTMPIIKGDLNGSVVTFAGNEGTSSPCKLTGFKITNGWVGEPTENLASHWKFDEMSGDTALDSVAYNYGTLVNGPVWTTGQIDGALDFDGVEAHVEIAGYKGILGRVSRTCTAWIMIDLDSYDQHTIISWGDDVSLGNRWKFMLQDHDINDKYQLRVAVSGGYKYGSTNLNDGLWHHVAATWQNDGTPDVDDVKLYVDGSEESYTSDSQTINTASGANVKIGNYLGATSESYFKGSIDDVRIYDRALGDVEIKQLYLLGIDPGEVAGGGGILGNGTGATISNCIIEGNTADDGGGIYNVDGDITNCIIAGNTAINDGGGLYDCDDNIINCTIVGNAETYYGGGLYECNGTIKNCIIWSNGYAYDYSGSAPDYSCLEYSSIGSGGEGNISTNPLFVNPDNNDYHIKRNSPCKNKGNSDEIDVGEVDIDGQPRQAGIVDMGADEVYEVHNTTQGIWYETIQAAVDGFNEFDEIVVYPGTYEENVTVVGQKPIEIRGTNPDDWETIAATVIDGGGLGNAVTFTSFRDPSWCGQVLTGLTITGGYHSGILCENVNLVISRCIIADNNLGIRTINNSTHVGACKIHNNTNYGIRFGAEIPMVADSWIYKNDTGIVHDSENSPIIANNTIVDNFTMGITEGPTGATPTITNCIIRDNSNDLDGCTATYSCVSTENLGDPATTHNIDDDPMFRFGAADNYHLSYGSPCIDTGYSSVGGSPDIDGDDRVIDGDNDGDAEIDRGADEYKWHAEGPVRIYTNDQYSGPALTDCQVHFGTSGCTGSNCFPDLYIEIDFTGDSSTVVDEIDLRVTSESGSIMVAFEETGENTNIFRTTYPIHLAESSDQDTRKLKVMNEEILYVDGVPGPKVDRGEIAAITAVAWDPSTDCCQVEADAAADDLMTGFTSIDYGWWNNGSLRYQGDNSVFQPFVKNVSDDNHSPADMLFELTHGIDGSLTGSCLSKPKPGGDCPGGCYTDCDKMDPSSDWNKDVEWVVLYSCNILGDQTFVDPEDYEDTWHSAYVEYWDDMLLNGCHGILSSSNDLLVFNERTIYGACIGPIMRPQLESFYEKLNSQTVLEAWMNSAIDITYPQWATAALFNKANINDRTSSVTPDPGTTDTTMYYTYFTYKDSLYLRYSEEWEGEPGISLGAESSVYTDSTSETERIELDDGLVIITCDIPTNQPKLTKIKAQKESLTKKDFDCKEFTETEFDNHGRIKLKKPYQDKAQERPIGLTEEQSKEKSKDFIRKKGGGLPDDAELTVTVDQMVQTYDSENPADTKSTYVKKRILEYGHKFNDIEIVGGNRGDNITVEIEDGEVVSLKRHWREIQEPVGTEQNVISARDALNVAVENLPAYVSSSQNKEYRINSIKLFYYGLPSEEDVQHLTPAWGFLVGRHTWVYVNAFTAELLY